MTTHSSIPFGNIITNDHPHLFSGQWQDPFQKWILLFIQEFLHYKQLGKPGKGCSVRGRCLRGNVLSTVLSFLVKEKKNYSQDSTHKGKWDGKNVCFVIWHFCIFSLHTVPFTGYC